LGLTRREINILLSEAPVDEATGEIVYNDFIPVAFPVLKDSFVHHLIDIPSDEDSLKQYLVDVFGSADTESTGFVSVSELAKLFRAADIGLTRLQIVTVIAEAQEDDNGYVNYEKFAGHVASMVLLLISFEIQQSFSSFLRNYRKSADYYTVLEQNQHSFEVSP
jgi:Ca2+-binding EF-hand superfamily protein